VHLERLDRVCATARIETAAGRQEWGHPSLVGLEQHQERPDQRRRPVAVVAGIGSPRPTGDHHASSFLDGPGTAVDEFDDRPRLIRRSPAGSTARSARSTSAARLAESAVAEAGNARTTSRVPGGSWSRRSRSTCRSRRVTRCRTTDPPTALLTTKPTRGPGWPPAGEEPSAGTRSRPLDATTPAGPADAGADGETAPVGWSGSRACITTSVRPNRRPRRITSAKSPGAVSRAAAGSTARRARSGRQLLPALAAPRGQNRPTGASPHSKPEAMGPRTAAVVRLKGALALGHFSVLPFSASQSAGLLRARRRPRERVDGPRPVTSWWWSTGLSACHSAPARDAVTSRVRRPLSSGQTGWRARQTGARPGSPVRASAPGIPPNLRYCIIATSRRRCWSRDGGGHSGNNEARPMRNRWPRVPLWQHKWGTSLVTGWRPC
jgi:hypothetical protein